MLRAARSCPARCARMGGKAARSIAAAIRLERLGAVSCSAPACSPRRGSRPPGPPPKSASGARRRRFRG
eukprot:3096447-Alexandrium_andersonii.AAC.1